MMARKAHLSSMPIFLHFPNRNERGLVTVEVQTLYWQIRHSNGTFRMNLRKLKNKNLGGHDARPEGFRRPDVLILIVAENLGIAGPKPFWHFFAKSESAPFSVMRNIHNKKLPRVAG
jgi:hypothetical protein